MSRSVLPYVLARLAQGVLVMVGAALIGFVLTNLSGNPADSLGGGGFLTPEAKKELARTLGYDKPLPERLVSYLGGVLQGDLGESYRTREAAADVVLAALPATGLLVATSLGLALLLSVPIGVLSVLKRDTRVDHGIRGALMLFGSLPDYWVALVLVLVFAVSLGILPSGGMVGASSVIMPTIAIAVPVLPTMVRILRGTLLDIAQSDYVTGLRAKGFSDAYILWRHGLRNALGPFATLVALQIGWLLGGTLIVEVVFSWPGIGSLLIDSVSSRDLAVVQATVVLVAFAYVVVNLAADVFVLFIDPRVRLAGT